MHWTERLKSVASSLRHIVFKTPFGALIALCAFSLAFEENYPFSDFPMYSNPSPEREYFLLADDNRSPVPVANLTGITCPKVGKIYRRKANEMAEESGRGWRDLTMAESQQIGGELLDYLRELSVQRGSQMPPRLRLELVRFAYDGGKFVETPKLLAAE